MNQYDARIILGMDASEAEERLLHIRSELEMMGDEVFISEENDRVAKRLNTRIGELQNTLSRITSETFRVDMDPEQVTQTREEIAKMQEALARMKTATQKETRASTEALYEMEGATQQMSFATGKMANEYNVKHRELRGSTLGTLNVLRVLQDAPYGITGMANNFNELAMSIGILTMRSGSLNGALEEMFGNFKKGPFAFMAIVSVITALLLKWDQMAARMESTAALMGLISFQQAGLNRYFREFEGLDPSGMYDMMTIAQARATDQMRSDMIPALREKRREIATSRAPIGALSEMLIEAGRNAGAAGQHMIGLGEAIGWAAERAQGFTKDMQDVNRDIRRLIEMGGEATVAQLRFANQAVSEVLPAITTEMGKAILEQQQLVDKAADDAAEAAARRTHTSIELEKAAIRAQTEHNNQRIRLNELLMRAEADRVRQMTELYHEGILLRQRGLEFENEEQRLQFEELERNRDQANASERQYLAGLTLALTERMRQLRRFGRERESIFLDEERQMEEAEHRLRRRNERLLGEHIRYLSARLRERQRVLEQEWHEMESAIRREDAIHRARMQNLRQMRQLELQLDAIRTDTITAGTAARLSTIENAHRREVDSWRVRMEDVEDFYRQQRVAAQRHTEAMRRLDAVRAEMELEMAGETHPRILAEIRARYDERLRIARDREAALKQEVDVLAENRSAMLQIEREYSEAMRNLELRRARERADTIRNVMDDSRQAILNLQADAHRLMEAPDIFQQIEGIQIDLRLNLDAVDRDSERLLREMEALEDKMMDLRLLPDLTEEQAQQMAEYDIMYTALLDQYQAYLEHRQALVDRAAEAERRAWVDMTNEAIRNLNTAVSNASSAASTLFDVWKDNRERQLQMEGHSSEQINAIIEEEGKKKFESMKKFMIAEAIIGTLSAGVGAFQSVWTSSLPLAAKIPMSAALMASTIATGYAQVQKIRSMTLGGGTPSGTAANVGSFTTLNQSVTAGRIAHFEAFRGPAGQTANAMDASARYTDRRIEQLKVTYDDRTAAHINRVGVNYNNRTGH